MNSLEHTAALMVAFIVVTVVVYAVASEVLFFLTEAGMLLKKRIKKNQTREELTVEEVIARMNEGAFNRG